MFPALSGSTRCLASRFIGNSRQPASLAELDRGAVRMHSIICADKNSGGAGVELWSSSEGLEMLLQPVDPCAVKPGPARQARQVQAQSGSGRPNIVMRYAVMAKPG